MICCAVPSDWKNNNFQEEKLFLYYNHSTDKILDHLEAAETNHHRLSGLKTTENDFSPFWRPEVQNLGVSEFDAWWGYDSRFIQHCHVLDASL